MKKAVFTVAIGPVYEAYGELTHPLMEKYAQKIGADFFICSGGGNYEQLAWNKLEFLQYLFDTDSYDAILHIDSDMLIRPDTPDVFEYFPKFTCLEENKFIKTNPTCIDFDGQTFHAKDYRAYARNNFNYDYQPEICLNTGFFLVNRLHRESFRVPNKQPIHAHYEQPYMNMMLYKNSIPFQDLPQEFNHIDNSENYVENLSKSFVPHFSGNVHHEKYKSNIERMKKVLAKWKEMGYDV